MPDRPAVLRVAAVAAACISLIAPSAATAAPASDSQALSTRRATPKVDPPGVVSPGVVGADISWPNCPRGMGVPGRRTLGLPLPKASAKFVVIGVTNGRAFTRNPCLSTHVAVAKARKLRTSAYTMLSYPNRSERRRYGDAGPYPSERLVDEVANVGYAQTIAAIDAMHEAGLQSPFLWIDIEPRAERVWSKTTKRNRALIRGALHAAEEQGLEVGIYTYAAAWRSITGGMKLKVPLWAPGHSHARTYAKRMAATKASCTRTGFTGGPLVMTQWVWRNRDYDITCPRIKSVKQPFWVDHRT